MITHQDEALVLVVDDDITTRFLLRGILEQEGFKVIEAGDGLEALETFEKAKPDVVLMDVMMPEMDGFDTCIRLRGLPGGDIVPVLMITARSDLSSVNKAFDVGATDYVTKPIHHTVLRKRVRRMVSVKRAEQAMLEGEAYFRLLAENARDVIYRYRLIPTPEYEYVSPAITTMTDYTPVDFYADPLFGRKLVHPEDYHLLQQLGAGDISTEPLVMRWVRKDGGIIWVEHRNTPVFNDDGELVAVEGIARDMTTRKQAEDALCESERHYQLIFDNSSELLFVYQLTEDELPGLFLEVNEHACRELGYSRPELLRLSCLDIIAPEKKEAVSSILHDLISTGHALFKMEYVTKAGKRLQMTVTAALLETDTKKTVLLMSK